MITLSAPYYIRIALHSYCTTLHSYYDLHSQVRPEFQKLLQTFFSTRTRLLFRMPPGVCLGWSASAVGVGAGPWASKITGRILLTMSFVGVAAREVLHTYFVGAEEEKELRRRKVTHRRTSIMSFLEGL